MFCPICGKQISGVMNIRVHLASNHKLMEEVDEDVRHWVEEQNIKRELLEVLRLQRATDNLLKLIFELVEHTKILEQK